MDLCCRTIGQAHEAVVKAIFEDGIDLTTEDGELTLEYPEPVSIKVEQPNCEPMISKACLFGEKFASAYVDQMLAIHPPCENSAAYYYSNRLFDYPDVISDNDIPRIIGNGEGNGVNQISWMIAKLVENPNSRRAVAITRFNPIDMNAHDPPCLTMLQAMIRDGKLNMYAVFRSNDMLSAWGMNAYGLTGLQDLIRTGYLARTGIELEHGFLMTTSVSAHIYWKRDDQELKEFKKYLYR